MSKLTHIDDKGDARMVDVSGKDTTTRTAMAEAIVRMKADTLALVMEGTAPKGDVLAVARVAGIMAAKKTSELIPLCHPLPISGVTVACEPDEALSLIRVLASVKVSGPTGVEMEAMTAASGCGVDDLRHAESGRARHRHRELCGCCRRKAASREAFARANPKRRPSAAGRAWFAAPAAAAGPVRRSHVRVKPSRS